MVDKQMHYINMHALMDKCMVKGYTHAAIAKTVNMVLNTSLTVANVDERALVVAGYRKQLDKLKELPRIDQRTPEWYAARQTLITASDFAQALGEGKFGTQKQLIQKKCGFEEDKFNNALPALRWGTMFEDAACTIYSQRYGTHMYDFGLIRHPTIDSLGASPDGVNECGIMVEIKCPWRRKIDGTVPMQYYYQIQGQLDVCGLSECDYWECEFIDSEDVEEIFAGASACLGERGAIVELVDNKYIYGPVSKDMTAAELVNWTDATKNECESEGNDVVKLHYYLLTKASMIRVYKDPDFLAEKLDQLKVVWDRIKGYRADEELYNKEVKSTAPAASASGKASYNTRLQGFAFVNV